MQLGMVRFGRMGSNLVRRLLPAGHECVLFDGAGAASRLADYAPLIEGLPLSGGDGQP
jgi:6-phosphogluconate dehydrogenase